MKHIARLLKITDALRKKYNRNFTLDGNLVGDIGEVLVAERYNWTLLSPNSHNHDAKHRNGKLVQIKASFKDRSYFPSRHVPKHIICVKILENGNIEELYNGPGADLQKKYILNRGLVGRNRYLFLLSGKILRKLNMEVPSKNKIKTWKTIKGKTPQLKAKTKSKTYQRI